MEDLDLVTVATFTLRHEAEIARARLAAEGIPAIVHADDEGGLNPGFFAEYGIRVAVRAEDEDRAGAALAADGLDAVFIHREHAAAMIAHSDFCAPEEACGLLAFDSDGALRFVYALTNVDASPHRFTVDPTEHFHALAHAERSGWQIAGSFHSHPGGAAEPSVTDVEAALDSTWLHVIVGAGRSIGAYFVKDGEVFDIEVVLVAMSTLD